MCYNVAMLDVVYLCLSCVFVVLRFAALRDVCVFVLVWLVCLVVCRFVVVCVVFLGVCM